VLEEQLQRSRSAQPKKSKKKRKKVDEEEEEKKEIVVPKIRQNRTNSVEGSVTQAIFNFKSKPPQPLGD